MSKWTWSLAAFLFGSGLFMVFKFGLKPRPVRMIKPIYVDSAQQAGEKVYQRLRHLLAEEPDVVFGVQQVYDSHFGVVEGFLTAAQSEGKGFPLRVRESHLVTSSWQETRSWRDFDFRKEREQIVAWISGESQRKTMVLPSVYSAHVIGETPLRLLEQDLKKRLMTISVVHLVLSPEDLPKIHPPCDGQAAVGVASVSALGCLAKRKSAHLFRRKMDRQRLVLTMEQLGQKDYVVYLHTPKK